MRKKVQHLISVSVLAVFLFIAFGSMDDDKSEKSNEPTVSEKIQDNEGSAQTEKVNTEKQAIIEKLKARAQRDWPNDYMTQEFWVNEQIEAYEYMLTIEDNSIKKQAQHDWPLDFITQKFWYNEQIEAKERMK